MKLKSFVSKLRILLLHVKKGNGIFEIVVDTLVKLEIGASFKRISLRVRNWARWIHSWINFEEHLQVGATFINTVSWRIDILFFLFISFFWNCFSLRWLEKIKIGSILDGRDSNIFRKSDEIEEESIEKFGK